MMSLRAGITMVSLQIVQQRPLSTGSALWPYWLMIPSQITQVACFPLSEFISG